MRMDGEEKDEQGGTGGVDLSSLQDLTFGPAWTESKPVGDNGGKGGERRQRPPQRRAEGGRDRRKDGASRPPRRDAGGGERPQRRERGGRDDRRDDRREPPFQPVVEVNFYPQDEPFRALCKAIRSTFRTYELFEIAQLILEKPERSVIVLNIREDGSSPFPTFFISVPDGLPFASEEDAVQHVMANHSQVFFTMEEATVDRPKGSFQAVSRCGITGELLGPPNYHRYQQLLQEHHARKLPGVPFARFQGRLETVREAELIEQWLVKMETCTRYTMVEGGETFDSLDAVRHQLLTTRRDAVVAESTSCRFPGRLLAMLPSGLIRRSVEAELEYQRKFPLRTANNLRGRLRRMKFSIYKKGDKGVSYVCGVKRRFRTAAAVFADSVQSLITFIETNPGIAVPDLPSKLLGIDVSRVVRPAPAEDSGTNVPTAAVQEQETTGEAPESDEATLQTKPAVELPAQSTVKDPSADDETRLRHLMLELHWLVSEGYVTELADGRLFAQPIIVAGSHGDHDSESDDDGENEQHGE